MDNIIDINQYKAKKEFEEFWNQELQKLISLMPTYIQDIARIELIKKNTDKCYNKHVNN